MKDEEIGLIFQKLNKKTEGTIIAMQEIINEATNVIAVVVNEKNTEIKKLKDELVKNGIGAEAEAAKVKAAIENKK